jgi:hypothetical protein
MDSFVCKTTVWTRWIPSIHPCSRVLRHVYRRGLDWFQQCQSFRLGYSSVLVHFVAYMHGWTKLTALLQFLLNKMDRDLPSCLQVLRHVYRRGLDWFQWCQSFRLGYPCVLVHFTLAGRTRLDAGMALLQFLMNEMDCDLPSCLQVLRHVYRRGLDWFQQHWSFCLGLAMCFGPFGTCAHSG